jgi:hypothetical protein
MKKVLKEVREVSEENFWQTDWQSYFWEVKLSGYDWIIAESIQKNFTRLAVIRRGSQGQGLSKCTEKQQDWEWPYSVLTF